MVQGEVRIPLELKSGMGPHLQKRWETRGSSQVVAVNSGFLLRCGGDLWTPLCCMKGVKLPLEFVEGTWDCSLGTAGKMSLMSRGRGSLLVFLELWREAWDSFEDTPTNSGSISCCLREVKSPFQLRGRAWDCSGVSAGDLWKG